MSKSEIYRIRSQSHGALANADKSKTLYSPLIRMEWKKYGYIPVSARNNITPNFWAHNQRVPVKTIKPNGALAPLILQGFF